MAATQGGQRSIGVAGFVLVLVGAALVLLAFRFLDWYDVPTHAADRPADITFSVLHANADQLAGAGAARAYFDWLAWVLLIAAIGVGVGAILPFPAADPLRVTGFLIGLLGVAATYFAIAQLHNAQVSAGAAAHSVFFNASWGMWATFAGFVATAAGAGLGPRDRVRSD